MHKSVSLGCGRVLELSVFCWFSGGAVESDKHTTQQQGASFFMSSHMSEKQA
jgi:hypothetical protein